MGIMTDLVIADEADAKAVLKTVNHAERWPTLAAKGVDAIKLATLAFILDGKALDTDAVVDYSEEFRLLKSKFFGGCYVFLVPPALIASVVAIEESKLPAITEAWLKTDELRLDCWEPKPTLRFLRQFKELAAKAVAAGKPVLMWQSL